MPTPKKPTPNATPAATPDSGAATTKGVDATSMSLGAPSESMADPGLDMAPERATDERFDLKDSLAPLYHRYPGQSGPQPAFVSLTKDGGIYAGWDGEIGGAVSFDVWHNRTLRFSVDPRVSGKALQGTLQSAGVVALLERIHAGHSVEWDGNNMVGRLSQEAKEAELHLEAILADVPTVEVWEAAEWISPLDLDDAWPRGTTLANAVAALEAEAVSQGIAIEDEVEEAILDKAYSILDKTSWAIGGRDLDRLDAHQALLEHSRKYDRDNCDDLVELLIDTYAVLAPEGLDGISPDERRAIYYEATRSAGDDADAKIAESTKPFVMAALQKAEQEHGGTLGWVPEMAREILVEQWANELSGWVENSNMPFTLALTKALELSGDVEGTEVLESSPSGDSGEITVELSGGRIFRMTYQKDEHLSFDSKLGSKE